jgi:hypothetical protein
MSRESDPSRVSPTVAVVITTVVIALLFVVVVALRGTPQHSYDLFYGRACGWTDLLRGARSVAQIRIDSISEPFVNPVNELTYTRVSATVIEVWLGDELPNPIELVTLGDARTRYEGTAVPEDNISGGFVLGNEFVVLLGDLRLDLGQGERTYWGLSADFQGNWRVSEGQAVDSDATGGRSMAVTKLRSKIESVWPDSRSVSAVPTDTSCAFARPRAPVVSPLPDDSSL